MYTAYSSHPINMLLLLVFHFLYLRVVAQITPIAAKTILQDSPSKIMDEEKARNIVAYYRLEFLKRPEQAVQTAR